MFIAAIAFACGVCLVKLTFATEWRPISWLLCSTAMLLGIALYWLSRRAVLSFLLALSSFFALGMLDYELKITAPGFILPVELFNVPVKVSGTVVRSEMPVWQPSSHQLWGAGAPEVRQSLDLDLEEVQLAGTTYKVKLGVRTTVYSPLDDAREEAGPLQENADWKDFRYGQQIHFRTKLRGPRNFNNPGAWDYRNYLAQQGIQALASAKANDIEVLPDRGGTRLKRWRSAVRRSVMQHIARLSSTGTGSLLPGWARMTPEDAGVLAAMVLGDRALLHRNTRTDFQKTGSYHLLVVSGLSVAILAFATFWLARWMHCSDAVATVLSILLTILYASLTDLGAPIQRAVLMSSIYLLSVRAAGLSQAPAVECDRIGSFLSAGLRSHGAFRCWFPTHVSGGLDDWRHRSSHPRAQLRSISSRIAASSLGQLRCPPGAASGAIPD